MDPFSERVQAIAEASGADVIGMLAWIDPVGNWWMAPLGSSMPHPDRAMPPEWIPIRKLRRNDG
jgi:hypothetical protein